MIDSLALTITLACVVAAVAVAATTARGRFVGDRVAPWLFLLEAALVLQGILVVIGLVRGHHVAEPATHLAYLVVSLVVLPVASVQIDGASGRWAGAVAVAALLVQAVVEVRLQTTWRSR